MRDRARFLRAGQGAAVEVEVLLDEVGGQQRGTRVDGGGGEPLLEGRQVGGCPQGGRAAQVVGLVDVHDEAGHGHAGSARPGVPVETGRQVGQCGPQGRVIGQERVAVGHRITVVGGQGRLQVHDALCAALGVGHTRQGEQSCGVGDVGLADRLVVLLAVVGLVGQADSGLDEGDHVGGGIVRVGAHVGAHEASDALAHEGAHDLGELLAAGGALDDVEVRAQGCGSRGVDRVLVEELSPQRGDACSVRVVERAAGRILGNCAGIFFGCVAQGVECAVHRAVGGNLVGGQPCAVYVAVKIVLGAHGGIHVCLFEDACEQCVRHALTLGCFLPRARDLEISGTRTLIYVTVMGCNSAFSVQFGARSANATLDRDARAHLCMGVCEFVQTGGEGAKL